MTYKSSKDRGRKPRPTFPLGINHQLYTSHVGVIRMKMCMRMFAGAPPPKFSGNQPTKDESFSFQMEQRHDYYSRYLMDLCVPWCRVMGLQLETGCPVEDYFKLWYQKLKL